MKAYNGHRSWAAWNVNLWLNNDERLYGQAASLVRIYGKTQAARILARALFGKKTPDGAKYNYTNIRLAL